MVSSLECRGMSPEERPILRVLAGCTAVGKTDLALAWAERNNAEILSCDSLLFYKGMDIGTAKPTKEELSRVPHHFVDCNELKDQMDVTRYAALARATAEDVIRRRKSVLVTGGSGFYLRCFFYAIADDVEVSPALREHVRSLGLAEALGELKGLNPEGLGALDVNNPRRVARALERCLASGRTLSELGREFAEKKSEFASWDVRLVRLDREKAELDERIARRVSQMLKAGLVREVEELDRQGLRENPSAARAIGYREVLAMRDGQLAGDALEATIVSNTRALVRKQRTWFRTQVPGHAVVDAGSLGDSSLPW